MDELQCIHILSVVPILYQTISYRYLVGLVAALDSLEVSNSKSIQKFCSEFTRFRLDRWLSIPGVSHSTSVVSLDVPSFYRVYTPSFRTCTPSRGDDYDSWTRGCVIHGIRKMERRNRGATHYRWRLSFLSEGRLLTSNIQHSPVGTLPYAIAGERLTPEIFVQDLVAGWVTIQLKIEAKLQSRTPASVSPNTSSTKVCESSHAEIHI